MIELPKSTNTHQIVKKTILVTSVSVTPHSLQLLLAGGRELYAPLAWFPRLASATPQQQSNWRLIGGGIGIHWPDIDEDISVESLLAVR